MINPVIKAKALLLKNMNRECRRLVNRGINVVDNQFLYGYTEDLIRMKVGGGGFEVA